MKKAVILVVILLLTPLAVSLGLGDIPVLGSVLHKPPEKEQAAMGDSYSMSGNGASDAVNAEIEKEFTFPSEDIPKYWVKPEKSKHKDSLYLGIKKTFWDEGLWSGAPKELRKPASIGPKNWRIKIYDDWNEAWREEKGHKEGPGILSIDPEKVGEYTISEEGFFVFKFNTSSKYFKGENRVKRSGQAYKLLQAEKYFVSSVGLDSLDKRSMRLGKSFLYVQRENEYSLDCGSEWTMDTGKFKLHGFAFPNKVPEDGGRVWVRGILRLKNGKEPGVAGIRFQDSKAKTSWARFNNNGPYKEIGRNYTISVKPGDKITVELLTSSSIENAQSGFYQGSEEEITISEGKGKCSEAATVLEEEQTERDSFTDPNVVPSNPTDPEGQRGQGGQGASEAVENGGGGIDKLDVTWMTDNKENIRVGVKGLIRDTYSYKINHGTGENDNSGKQVRDDEKIFSIDQSGLHNFTLSRKLLDTKVNGGYEPPWEPVDWETHYVSSSFDSGDRDGSSDDLGSGDSEGMSWVKECREEDYGTKEKLGLNQASLCITDHIIPSCVSGKKSGVEKCEKVMKSMCNYLYPSNPPESCKNYLGDSSG